MNVKTAWADLLSATSPRLLEIALLSVVAATGWIAYFGTAYQAGAQRLPAVGLATQRAAGSHAVDQPEGEASHELPKEYQGVRRAGDDYEPPLISAPHHPN